MTQNAIDLIFHELKTRGQCRGRSDFSQWMGKETSYYRSLQCKGREPSVEAQLHLAARLRHLGAHLAGNNHPKIANAGKAYLKLYNDLIEGLLEQAHADTTNAEFEMMQS